MKGGAPAFPYPSQLEAIQNPFFSDSGRISWHQQLARSNHLPGLGGFWAQVNQASADLQSMAGQSRRSHHGMSNPSYGVDSSHHWKDLLHRACRESEELRRFAWSPEIGGFLPYVYNIALWREYSEKNQRLAAGNEHRQRVENSGQDSWAQANQASADLQSMAGLSSRSHPNGMSNPFYGVDSTHHGQDLLRRAYRANEELRRFAWSLRSPEIGGFLPHDLALSREYSATSQRLAAGNEHRQWVENSRQDSPPRILKRNDSHEGHRREDGERRMEGSKREESSATEEREGGETQQASDNVADQLKQISKPSRPLTAYNIFFKDQRLVLIEEASAQSHGGKSCHGGKSSKNSRKNQSTGIPFTLMGKKIGSKWQNLSVEEEKKCYVEKAEQDKVRHQNEMKEYNWKREVLMSSYHEKQMSSVDDSVLSRYYAHHGGKRSLERRTNRLGKSKHSRKDSRCLPKSETLGDDNCTIG